MSGEAARVGKVELRRVSLDELVLGDDELRGCALVRLVGEGQARALLAQALGRRFGIGARLFVAGDAGDSLFLVLKGQVCLLQPAGGGQVEVAVVRKGELFGEREVLGASPHRAFCALCEADLEVVELPRALLQPFLRKGSPLEGHLRQLDQARGVAGAELADFLNRW